MDYLNNYEQNIVLRALANCQNRNDFKDFSIDEVKSWINEGKNGNLDYAIFRSMCEDSSLKLSDDADEHLKKLCSDMYEI